MYNWYVQESMYIGNYCKYVYIFGCIYENICKICISILNLFY